MAERPDPVTRLVRTAKWLKDNPDVVVDAARGLLPRRPGATGAGSAAAVDHEPPAELADYSRTAQAVREVPTDLVRTHATVTDLGRIGDWLAMHQGWRGEAPAGAAVAVRRLLPL